MLKFIFEVESMFHVNSLLKVYHLCRRLMDWVRGVPGIIDQDRNATIWVQSQVPYASFSFLI